MISDLYGCGLLRTSLSKKREWVLEWENQREYLDRLARSWDSLIKTVGIMLPAKRSQSAEDMESLSKYSNSPSKMLQIVYPKHDWKPWMFHNAPMRYWNVEENQRDFLDRLGEKLGFNDKSDWYRATKEDFSYHGGASLLAKYGKFSNVLRSVYHDHRWDVYKFEKIPDGYWDSLDNRKSFMRDVYTELEFTGMDDWYKITQRDIRDRGGSRLLNHYYGNSPSKLLLDIYPDHQWKVWRFQKVPRGYWNRLESIKDWVEFMDWLSTKLEIRYLSDWYRVSLEQIQRVIPLATFDNNPLDKVLQEVYPKHPWDSSKLRSKGNNRKAAQRILAVKVEALFPDSEVKENYCGPLQRDSSRKLELDLFLPKEKLAFEYQGEQHYHDIFALGHRWRQQQKDTEKREICSSNGITLIEVPYWWDQETSSLIATINKHQRGLLIVPEGANPIPEEPRGGFEPGLSQLNND